MGLDSSGWCVTMRAAILWLYIVHVERLRAVALGSAREMFLLIGPSSTVARIRRSISGGSELRLTILLRRA